MTMHIQKGLSTLNTRKPRKKKYTTKQLEKLETDRKRHNKEMRRQNLHRFQIFTLEDYLKYLKGEYKPKPSDKKVADSTISEKPYVRVAKHYPSLSDAESGYAPKKENDVYTGTLIKGIGVMHKSNAVPVTDSKQMEELSKMSS
mgnify:FL=1